MSERTERMEKQLLRPVRQRQSKRWHGWNTGYFLREGFFGIFKHGLMSFAALCMIVACLLIMGTFTLVAVNLDVNRQKMEAENEFSAYVDESLSQEAAQALEEKIRAIPNVRETLFVDRSEVLTQFRADHDSENDLYALLPEDTFRHRYRVRVTDIAGLEATISAVDGISGIDGTSSAIEVAEGMVAVRDVATGVAAILVTLLALVSLFIIANTLRLAAFYRRDEVAIMKMCGATNAFIRWPFVVEGALLGLISALCAFFLQWLVYDLLAGSVATGGQLNFLVIVPFAALWKNVLLAFSGAGLVIGILGSVLAIRRFLKV